jgi:hypothetical protein
MGQVDDTALAEHDIEVEILGKSLPELQGVVVEVRVRFQHVVGTHDGGIAPGVATPQPALFQHRNIADAVFLGQVVSSRKPMPTTTDHDYVVMRPRFRTTPGLPPPLVIADGITCQIEYRVTHPRPPGADSATIYRRKSDRQITQPNWCRRIPPSP